MQVIVHKLRLYNYYILYYFTLTSYISYLICIVIEVDKYIRQSTDTDFDSDLVVEGVVLELKSLTSVLKNF